MEKTVETGAFSREKIGEFIKDYGAIIGIVIILLVFQIFDHRFLRPANVWGVCKSSAVSDYDGAWNDSGHVSERN